MKNKRLYILVLLLVVVSGCRNKKNIDNNTNGISDVTIENELTENDSTDTDIKEKTEEEKTEEEKTEKEIDDKEIIKSILLEHTFYHPHGQEASYAIYRFYDDGTFEERNSFYINPNEFENLEIFNEGTYEIIDGETICLKYEKGAEIYVGTQDKYYLINNEGFITDVIHQDYDPNMEDGPDNITIDYASVLIPYDEEWPDYEYITGKKEEYIKKWYQRYGYPNCNQQNSNNFEENSTESNNNISKDQAYNAVINYCCIQNPDLANISPEEHAYYWNIEDDSNGKYVVTYRSYTGAIIYYHIDPVSGDVYTTEFVPGITDGEVEGTESFNIKDYY